MKKINTKTTLKVNKNEVFFDLFFLTAIYGLIWFKLGFNTLLSEIIKMVGETKTKDLLLYVLGWVVTVSFGSITTLILKRIIHKNRGSYVYSVLCLLNFGFTLFIINPSQWAKPTLPLFIFFVLLQPLGFLISIKLNHFTSNTVRNFSFGGVLVSGLLWLLIAFPIAYFSSWSFYNYLIFVGILLVFIWNSRTINIKTEKKNLFIDVYKRIEPFIDIALYLFIFIAVVCLINVDAGVDPYHFSFYLGPLSDLIGGKSLLVNINAQYGVGVFYFLRLFFYILPIGFESFRLILIFLTVFQFIIFCFISKKIFRSESLSLFIGAVFLLITYFTEGSGIIYPAVGPLRFFLIYVLSFLVVIRNEHPALAKKIFWIECFVAAYAVTWSLEVLIYIVPAYCLLLIYESFKLGKKIVFNSAIFIKRILIMLGFVAINLTLLYMDVFRRTTEWPHWSYYFDYIFDFSRGVIPVFMEGVGYWWVSIGIIYISFWCVLKMLLSRGKTPPHFNLIILITFFGIFQFLYYIYRPELAYLGWTAMPGILLGVYWLIFIRRFHDSSVPKPFTTAGYFLAVIFIGILIQETFPITVKKLTGQNISIGAVVDSIHKAFNDHGDASIDQLNALVRQYSGDKKSVVYFFGDTGLYFSMYTGHTNIYPYNDVDQAGPKYPDTYNRILHFDPNLKKGDFIYTTHPSNFEETLFNQINFKYKLKLITNQYQVDVYQVLE